MIARVRTVKKRSLKRKHLAEAIIARDNAASEIKKLEGALDRAQRVVWEARDHLEQALVAFDEDHLGEGVAAAALAGNRPAPDRLVQEGHAGRTRAQEALAAAQSGLQKLRATLLDRQRELELANEEVDRAASAVLADECPRDLSALLKTAEQRFVELRGVMTWFLKHGARSNEEAQAYKETQSCSAMEARLRQGVFFPEDQQTGPYQALDQCFQRLKSDADMPLPPID